MLKLKTILKEIGDASVKPYTWKSSIPFNSWMDKVVGEAEKSFPPGTSLVFIDGPNYKYTFTSTRTKIKYEVNIQVWVRKVKNIIYGPNRANNKYNEKKFAIDSQVGFSIEGQDETNTNLNEHYAVMATVIQCIYDFIKNIESSEFVQFDEIVILPKADTTDDAKIDSKRGRLYLAYIKKLISTLPSKRKFSVVPMADEGYSIKVGDRAFSIATSKQD